MSTVQIPTGDDLDELIVHARRIADRNDSHRLHDLLDITRTFRTERAADQETIASLQRRIAALDAANDARYDACIESQARPIEGWELEELLLASSTLKTVLDRAVGAEQAAAVRTQLIDALAAEFA